MKTLIIFRLVFHVAFLMLVVQAYGQLSVSITTTDDCNMSGSATATVSGGSGTYNYTWYDNSFAIVRTTNGAGSTDALTNVPGGNYYLFVEDNTGNSAWAWTLINPPFVISVTTTPDTCNQGKGTATASVSGGAPPYTYLWSDGQTTQTAVGLVSGVYDVRVEDANGCAYSAIYSDTMGMGGVWISNYSPVSVTVSATPASCKDGTATATASGGTPPYAYLWNTVPVQTSQTATGLNAGWYAVIVSDNEGCTRQQGVWVPWGPNAFQVTISSTPDTCAGQTGTAAVTASGGVAPYTYLWSNGETTASIAGLSAGTYRVVVTDANGCEVRSNVTVTRFNKIKLSFSVISPSCGGADGAATVHVTNGTPPYSYVWSNGQTSQQATGLREGCYNVRVTDAEGCTQSSPACLYEPLSCKIKICGLAYHDQNGNCAADAFERKLKWGRVSIQPGGRTYSTPQYNAYVTPGTYTISFTPPRYWEQTCPASPSDYTVTATTLGDVLCGYDFGAEIAVLAQDLSVHHSCGTVRPGFTNTVYLCYQNRGTVVMNGSVSFTHDTLVQFISSVPMPDGYDPVTRRATWNFTGLDIQGERCVQIQLDVPATVALGTVLKHCSEILPVVNDSMPKDNKYCSSCIVQGAVDPNFKEVAPGLPPLGLISPSENLLVYTVHFQNTGTDTAFTVVIQDTLEHSLLPATLHPVGSSHPFEISFPDSHIVTFTFNNILLPDSTINEPASHGFVQYTIQLKPGLPHGTQIKNRAGIYFDFNEVVLTEYAINTIDTTIDTTGIFIIPAVHHDAPVLQIFPNPADESFQLLIHNTKGENEIFNIIISNIIGQTIVNLSINSNQPYLINTGKWPTGMYFIRAADTDIKPRKLSIIR